MKNTFITWRHTFLLCPNFLQIIADVFDSQSKPTDYIFDSSLVLKKHMTRLLRVLTQTVLQVALWILKFILDKWFISKWDPTGVNSSVAAHHATTWVIKAAPGEPIRSAVLVGAQCVSGQHKYWSRREEVNTRARTLNQHTLCLNKSSLCDILSASMHMLPKVAIFLSTPPPNSLTTVSHHGCVPAERLGWVAGLTERTRAHNGNC